MRKLPQGDELLRECERQGISIEPMSSLHPGFFEDSDKELILTNKTEKELQQRLLEFKRARREARLWIIAIASAAASVLSAAAAIIAVGVKTS